VALQVKGFNCTGEKNLLMPVAYIRESPTIDLAITFYVARRARVPSVRREKAITKGRPEHQLRGKSR
jgi:hypothetical protein